MQTAVVLPFENAFNANARVSGLRRRPGPLRPETVLPCPAIVAGEAERAVEFELMDISAASTGGFSCCAT